MQTPFKKIATITTTIALALAYGSAGAAENTITFEAATTNNGTGNAADINSSGSNKIVSIYQVGSGNGSGDAEKNQVGQNLKKLVLNGDVAGTAHIGQGAFWNGTAWTESKATKGNAVTGTVTDNNVFRISQNSDGNTVTLNSGNGSGLVTINQGYAAAGGGGGSGFTAEVTQKGSGAVTINQGNDATALGTDGTATVVHDGTHTVAITQFRTNAGSTGTILTNTTGDGGALTITQSNSGNTYVNAAGDNGNAAPATITGTADLINAGTGTLALTQATGTVKAHVNGSGTLTIDNGGTNNNVYVNAEGDANNTTAIANGGTLTLNSDGTSNTLIVTSFTAGTLTVNQDALMTNSTLTLSGGSTTNATINQNGSYQNATVTSSSGSTGIFNLDAVGTVGTPAIVNLTI